MYNKYAFPEEEWKTIDKPIQVRIADNSLITLGLAIRFLNMIIAGEKFLMPTIYQQELGVDLLIGNNFLNLYRPFIQDLDFIVIHTLDRYPVYVSKEKRTMTVATLEKFIEQHKKRKCGEITEKPKPPRPNKDFREISKEEEEVEETLRVIEIKDNDYISSIIEHDKKMKEIQELLRRTSFENPLDCRIKQKDLLGKIILKDPSKVIRVKPMMYSPDDRKEFEKQIKELLDMKLIIPSKSPHSSPTF